MQEKTEGERLDSETNLQRESPFFTIFNASLNLMILTTVEEGRIVCVNEAYARLTGFAHENLIGRTTHELGLWKSLEARNELLAGLDAAGKIRYFELDLPKRDGKPITALFSIEKITLEDRPYLLSVALDISERKIAEQELRASEEKYRYLVEQSLQGLSIVQDSRFVFCNNRLSEMLGYAIQELLALSPDQVSEIIHPGDRAHIAECMRSLSESGSVRFECRALQKDGTEIWTEICSRLIDYKGSPAFQSAIMDISDRKRAAEELQRVLDWQKAIFEGSRDAIFISDRETKFVDVNKAACTLTGYPKEELLNMKEADLQREINLPILDDLRNRIMAGEEILAETLILTKEGKEIDVEFGHLRVMVSGVPYMYTIARDVTNRKRLEAQFLQAQKMEAVGALAGGVAHDFNNLLTVINGYAELLIDDFDPEDHRRADVERIQKAGQQATSLVSQLLAFSRKQILNPEIINLNEIITEVSHMLRRLIGEHIEFAARTDPKLDLINADPAQIQQIVMNLAVNARDAMPYGGKLTIETSNVEIDAAYIDNHPAIKPGSYVMLAISDNGIGMDAETKARLFEPFFTTKVKGKGTGLGLSTVYGIVKQSNGYVWVYSELGQGTTFKMYFPCIKARQSNSRLEAQGQSEIIGSETILVVEDEAPVRALTSRILRDRGFTVIEALDGNEALAIADHHSGPIHLVLTDVIMPGISGVSLVSKLETKRAGIKAIYISGYADNAIVHQGILNPDVDFVQKPFSVDKLLAHVKKALNK